MKFIADDGKIFDTLEECEEYEKLNNEGNKIAQLWYDCITTYDDTGHTIESLYDYKKDVKSYLDDTAAIVTDYAIFLDIGCTSDEWKKINKYFYKKYGLVLPSYVRGLSRYDYEEEHWISFSNDYDEFKKRWAPMGIRF